MAYVFIPITPPDQDEPILFDKPQAIAMNVVTLVEERAEATKLPLKQVREVRDAARAVTSLDKPLGDDDSSAYGDLVASDQASVEEEVQVSLTQTTLHRAISELPDREQEILKLRYGLNGDEDPKSLEEIGKRMGITRERVRQLESEALRRLAERREIAALKHVA